ncbi:hypothetical protein BaRGS_00025202 [Batillaria attramentaria]|uniref:ATP synthase subunit s-like protein n=1 Tax=Batillaria attramentaria TaxID=370345 RepID=A0ABD0K8Z1_9CAEN
MAALVRSLKQTRLLQYVVPWRSKFTYTKVEGVPREWINWLSMDFDLSRDNIARFMAKKRWQALLEDHKFIPERHDTLGPDLATAHFLVRRGAKVKFVGRDTWFKQDEKGNMYLPTRMVPGLSLEAIDATGIDMTYVAFDNMIMLDDLCYLNFSKCRYFNDWCMARLHIFKDTLEFLDISGCTEVTHNGLACLHHLKKLKGLKLSDLPNVQDIGLMILLLEETLPECTVFGVDLDKLQPPSDGQLSARLAAITSENTAERLQSSESESDVQHTHDSEQDGLKEPDRTKHAGR